MFGIGFTEAIILGIVVMIFLGPDQLPNVLKGFGKFFREIQKARDEFNRSVDRDEELKKIRHSMRQVKDVVDGQVQSVKKGFEEDLKRLAQEKEKREAELAATLKDESTTPDGKSNV